MRKNYLRKFFLSFPILIGLFIFSGFYLHTEVLHQPKGFSLALYQTLQLYVLESDPDILKSSWMILLGSFLAPASLASAIIFNAFEFGRKALQLIYIRLFLRNHIIISGTDSFSLGLLKTEKNILFINSEDIDESVLTVKSDLFSLRTWRNSGIKKSRAVIISLDNVANAPLLCEIMEKTAGFGNMPPVYFSMNSDEEYEVVSDASNMLKGGSSVPVRAISMKRIAATVLVEKNAPHHFLSLNQLSREPVHLLFYGFNDFAEKVLLESVQYYIYPYKGPLEITIITDNAGQLSDLMTMYPGIYDAASLQTYNLKDFDTILRMESQFSFKTMPCQIYFFPENNWMIHVLTRRWERFLLGTYGQKSSEINMTFVLSADEDNPVLHKAYVDYFPDSHIEIFDESDLVSVRRLLTEETLIDSIGRRIHERYAEKYEIEPWDELTDRQKEFNRRSARHLMIKLAYLGYAVIDKEVESENPVLIPTLNDEQVSVLAEMEHRRWTVEKYLDDFLPLSVFPENSIHPSEGKRLRIHKDLKPFSELNQEDIQKDINTFHDWWDLIRVVLRDKCITQLRNDGNGKA